MSVQPPFTHIRRSNAVIWLVVAWRHLDSLVAGPSCSTQGSARHKTMKRLIIPRLDAHEFALCCEKDEEQTLWWLSVEETASSATVFVFRARKTKLLVRTVQRKAKERLISSLQVGSERNRSR